MTRIVTTTQAAEHFGVNTKTIRRWIQSGKLNGERIDNRWHVRIEDNDGRLNDPEKGAYTTQSFSATLEPANSENVLLREQLNLLRDQLTLKDKQIDSHAQQVDHLTQVVAMSQKNIGALTEQLDDSRQLIEDMRSRSWWKRIFRR